MYGQHNTVVTYSHSIDRCAWTPAMSALFRLDAAGHLVLPKSVLKISDASESRMRMQSPRANQSSKEGGSFQTFAEIVDSRLHQVLHTLGDRGFGVATNSLEALLAPHTVVAQAFARNRPKFGRWMAAAETCDECRRERRKIPRVCLPSTRSGTSYQVP